MHSKGPTSQIVKELAWENSIDLSSYNMRDLPCQNISDGSGENILELLAQNSSGCYDLIKETANENNFMEDETGTCTKINMEQSSNLDSGFWEKESLILVQDKSKTKNTNPNSSSYLLGQIIRSKEMSQSTHMTREGLNTLV